MSDWLKSLVGYMLIVSVAMQMLPNKKYEQYVRLFTGFLLIVLVLQPILKIGSADSYLENKISAFVQEQESIEAQIGKEAQNFQNETKNMQSESLKTIEIEPIHEIEVNLDD